MKNLTFHKRYVLFVLINTELLMHLPGRGEKMLMFFYSVVRHIITLKYHKAHDGGGGGGLPKYQVGCRAQR
jgi:hypothetical protein